MITKPSKIESCEVYTTMKMRNWTNRYISKRKDNLLDFILINICGPLPTALSGARYFLKIVNNYTRKYWVIPLYSRIKAKSTLKK